MKVRKISKVFMGTALLMALTFASLAPSLNVEAHETLYGPSRETTIWVKGARLRATGSTTGTVLGLMYVDEKIIVYTQMLGEDTEFNYIHRLKPDMWGYTDHHNYN